MKELSFIAPKDGQPKYDDAYEYKVMLNGKEWLTLAPGQAIEISRYKKPRPLTPEGLLEDVIEQLERDGEIKDSDELARKLMAFKAKASEE